MVAKSSNSLTAKEREDVRIRVEFRIEDTKRRIRHDKDLLKSLTKYYEENYGVKK